MIFFYIWVSVLLTFELGEGYAPPKDWIQLTPDSFYFQIFDIKLSFWNADKHCQKHYDANLVTITSNANLVKINQELKSRNVTESWIGLTDFGKEGKFYWVSNYEKINVNNWEKTYPRDFRQSSDCALVKINTEGKYTWIDVHCAEKHIFICMWMNKTDTQKVNYLPHQSHYTNQCPKPFFPVDGDCFWISPENLTWEESRIKCQRNHQESDLASIRTIFQQEYFAALISGNSTAFWIGLNFHNNEYQWILQNDITITKWGTNEPNNIEKNCTFMSGNEHKLGEWYSAFCNKKLKAICQTLKKNNSSQPNDTTASETDVDYDSILFKKGDCEKPRYNYYHGSCYRLISEKHVSYEEAMKLCSDEIFENKTGYKFQVNLVNFQNAGEKYLILSNLRRSVSDLPNNGLWLGIKGIKSENTSFLSITFSKNSRVSEFEYASNPKTSSKNMCFKLLLNGIVNASDCDDKSTAITMCQYRSSNFDKRDLNSNNLIATCPKDWKLFNSVCFYFSDKRLFRSQYDARKECMKLDSHLPSIDMQQQRFVNSFFTSQIAIGVRDADMKAWIGLQVFKKSDKHFEYKWINETPIRYINLKMSQFIYQKPNDKKWCALLSPDNGLWELVNCTGVKATLICQKQAKITKIQVSSTTIPTTTTKPVEVFISKPGYVFENEKVTWEEARQKCSSMNVSEGYISNLADFKQYSELLEVLSPYRNSHKYWIGLSGLYDHFDNSFLRWSDNSPMVFQNFDYDNLMTVTGNENCVAMDIVTGKWNAIKCNKKQSFICRISKRNSPKENNKPLKGFFDIKNWTQPRFCPDKYFEHNNKCYHVVEDKILDWKSADKYCHELLPEKYRYTSYLASIESSFENSFVYSLLSSNINSNNDTRYWIGERYKNLEDSKQLCVAMSGHPDPYIGARWFTVNCSKKLKFICSSLKIPKTNKVKHSSKCLDHFVEYENSLGTSCYSFVRHLNNLKEAKLRCSYGQSKSLLSIQSHYHMHFIRNQMEFQGYSLDRHLWLGAEIESHQNYYNWQWQNGQSIRYSIWNKPPLINSNTSDHLCFYMIMGKDIKGRLGMQIEECKKLIDKKYIVCEYTVANDKDMASFEKEFNVNCLRDPIGNNYEGQMNNTVNGNRCIRWDLLNPSSVLTKIIYSVRTDPIKHKYIQYQSNECRYIKNMGRQTTFCAIEKDFYSENVILEECMVQFCKNVSKTLHHEVDVQVNHSNTLTVVLVTLVLFLCIIVCIALLSWHRWNKGALFGGYLRRSQFSFLNNQSRGTSFNNPIYRPINT